MLTTVTAFIQKQKINGMPSASEHKELPFESERFKEVWEKWLNYRREQKLRPYKPIGLEMVLKKLVRLSNGYEPMAIDLIIQAMENTWQGIYPLQKDYYGTAKNNQPGASANQRGTSADRIKRAKDW
jgi:hypothetical protein